MASYSIAKIAELSDDRFAELVTKHLYRTKGDPELWNALLGEQLIERTCNTLREMLDRANAASAKRKNEINQTRVECALKGRAGTSEWIEAHAVFEEWRLRNSHFKQMVQERLGDVRDTRRQRLDEARQASRPERLIAHAKLMDERVRSHREALRQLVVRVHQHQALTASTGRAPEQHDYDLWRLLDELTIPTDADQHEATLRDMARTYWFDTTPATVAGGQRAQAERLMRQAPAGHAPQYEGVPKVRHIDQAKRLT